VKGNATVHTTNEKFRDGYDAIFGNKETPIDTDQYEKIKLNAKFRSLKEILDEVGGRR